MPPLFVKHTIMLAELQILGIVALAAMLGGVIGLDREIADKPAGFRTHMLVSASAALLISLTNVILPNSQIDAGVVSLDPLRSIEAIIAGVAFLGAGTIIRHKSGVEGLTTGASLLYVMGVGIAVALSQFVLALGLTVMNLLILRGIKLVEKALQRREVQLGMWSKSEER